MAAAPTSPPALDLERLAYDAALRALDHQEGLAAELRSRAGLLVTVASLAVPFLAREAFTGDPQRGLVAAALGAFLMAVGANVYVLLPDRDEFVFALVGSRVYESLYFSKDDLASVLRTLTYQLDSFWSDNDHALRRLTLALRIGAVALAAEIAMLAAMTADTLLLI